MSSLKEIKGRIASVRSTLQITSAMKMVAAAKLHRAQGAIGNMLPYSEKLQGILTHLIDGGARVESPMLRSGGSKVALVAFSSNSSLCGAFNSVAVKSALKLIKSLEEGGTEAADIRIYAVGKKVADGIRKAGYQLYKELPHLVDKPSWEEAAALAGELMESFAEGEVGRVCLCYNHYASNSSQPPVAENYLPLALGGSEADESATPAEDIILEPDAESLVTALIPKVLLLKIYTVVMDSFAAENAARTVAMQMASDNADKLLEELNLEYNKRRQQAITSELLDIVGGTMA